MCDLMFSKSRVCKAGEIKINMLVWVLLETYIGLILLPVPLILVVPVYLKDQHLGFKLSCLSFYFILKFEMLFKK